MLFRSQGVVQPSLFDKVNLAEITHPDYPGERLVVCHNPALGAERARKRAELLAATAAELDKVAVHVEAGKLVGAAKIGVRVGRVLGRFKMAKHFTLDITDTSFGYTRNQPAIEAEAALDGIYVVRASVAASDLDAAGLVDAYKRLSNVERDFRSLKTVDLELRPIHHHLEPRVRAHVLLCLLAAYLVWHLRKAWAPLTFTDEAPPQRSSDPVAPTQRSQPLSSRHHSTSYATAPQPTASPPCSPTWPPSPATTSSSPARPGHRSKSSPPQPRPSARPSSSSRR